MTLFEKYPKLIDFCTKVTNNFTEVNENKVVFVRNNLLEVNNCRCLLNDDVGQILIYPEQDKEPVLIVRITESVKLSLDFVNNEQEVEYGGVRGNRYRDYGYDIFIKTLKEMGTSQTGFAKYKVMAGMSKEISGQEK